jgi:hypothetical protein
LDLNSNEKKEATMRASGELKRREAKYDKKIGAAIAKLK